MTLDHDQIDAIIKSTDWTNLGNKIGCLNTSYVNRFVGMPDPSGTPCNLVGMR